MCLFDATASPPGTAVHVQSDEQATPIRNLVSAFGDLVLMSNVTTGEKNPQEAPRLRDAPPVGHFEMPAYWRVDAASQDGSQACCAFLAAAGTAADTMSLMPFSRKYRINFSPNYQAVFPDESRHYNADIMEAALASQSIREICVNGENYQFSVAVMHRGHDFRRAWGQLAEVLSNWPGAAVAAPTTEQQPFCPCPACDERKEEMECQEESCLLLELKAALRLFDQSWAQFEQQYISELISIEFLAREPLRKAIWAVRRLDTIDLRSPDADPFLIDKAIDAVAHLNTLANPHGKGRGDLSGRVLRSALSWLTRDEGRKQCVSVQA
ncbi:unnamed protein product, partial [Polarella glacialis]